MFAIDIPRVGLVRDSNGVVREIQGIAGNFATGAPLSSADTLTFAWNGSLGIRKSDTIIEVMDSLGQVVHRFDAPVPGEVVISLDVPGIARLFSNLTGELYEIDLSQWRMTRVPVNMAFPEGVSVLALAGGRDSASFVLSGPAGGLQLVQFDLASANPVSTQTLLQDHASAAVLVPGGAVLGATGAQLWLTRPDGTAWSQTLEFQPVAAAWMGSEWVQLRTDSGQQFAVRLRAGEDPRVYQLPGGVEQQ